jgi:hypothetical protein
VDSTANALQQSRCGENRPVRREKNCDYNINMKMKNFPFELSIQIMLIVDKKGIAKTSQFFMNSSGE